MKKIGIIVCLMLAPQLFASETPIDKTSKAKTILQIQFVPFKQEILNFTVYETNNLNGKPHQREGDYRVSMSIKRNENSKCVVTRKNLDSIIRGNITLTRNGEVIKTADINMIKEGHQSYERILKEITYLFEGLIAGEYNIDISFGINQSCLNEIDINKIDVKYFDRKHIIGLRHDWDDNKKQIDYKTLPVNDTSATQNNFVPFKQETLNFVISDPNSKSPHSQFMNIDIDMDIERLENSQCIVTTKNFNNILRGNLQLIHHGEVIKTIDMNMRRNKYQGINEEILNNLTYQFNTTTNGKYGIKINFDINQECLNDINNIDIKCSSIWDINTKTDCFSGFVEKR